MSLGTEVVSGGHSARMLKAVQCKREKEQRKRGGSELNCCAESHCMHCLVGQPCICTWAYRAQDQNLQQCCLGEELGLAGVALLLLPASYLLAVQHAPDCRG